MYFFIILSFFDKYNFKRHPHIKDFTKSIAITGTRGHDL